MNLTLHLLGVEVFSLSFGNSAETYDREREPFGFQGSGTGVLDLAPTLDSTYYEDE